MKSKTNRNAWTDDEVSLLIKCVEQSKNKKTGLHKAAEKLGRSASACSVKYYVGIDKSVRLTNTVKHTSIDLLKTTTLSFKIKSLQISNGELTIQI